MLIASFHSTLPDGGLPNGPAWLHLIPAGTFHGSDGRGPYRMGSAAAVIAASMTSGQLPVDENHATDHAMTTGQPSPARGWIVELQSRDDGIWGRVEWNEAGRALMSEKAYKGVSPVFTHDKNGVVLQLLRAALTNTPNLAQLATLHSTETTMNIADLRAALGLPETADEAACLAAVTQNRTAIAAHGTAIAAHGTAIAAIATAAGASAQTPEAIVTALQAQQTNLVPLARVVALQTQLDTLVATQTRDAAVAFVDAAIRAGKPIVSVRDQMIAHHVANKAAAEAIINGLPSIHAGGIALQAANPDDYDGETMSAEDLATCTKMGMEPKAFAKHKKKMRELVTQDGSKA